MTIWYFDPDGGDNSNDGQSFANRKKYNEYSNRTLFDGGDEIRFIKSPDPTSLGNATWTTDAAQYQRNSGWDTWLNNSWGNREFLSLSVTGNAAPNPTSVSKNSHGLATGDTIYFEDNDYKAPGAYEITVVDDDNFTLDGTENAPAFTATSYVNNVVHYSPFRVLLATACTKNIICYQSEGGIGDKDWTATLGTTYRETGYFQNGWKSSRGFKPGTSGTGKAAYVELENALDLSGYQQISFKVIFDYLQSSQEQGDAIMSLRLCTDTTGDTSVHTIPITMGFDISDSWYAVVHDFGTNLNSSIQSVALYVDTALGHNNTEIIIDNVIACKAKSSADSLTHASLISKGNTHDSEWYSIRGIDGKRILVDVGGGSHSIGNGTAYSGATETVTTYKRECFRRPTFYSTQERYYSPFFVIDEQCTMAEGAAGGITVSGGWNTTDMSSQDTNSGTWFDVVHPSHYCGMYFRYTNFLTISKFGVVRGYKSYQALTDTDDDGRYMTLNNCHSVSGKYSIDPTPESTLNNCNVIRSAVFFIDEGAYNSSSIWKDCKFIDAEINMDTFDAIERKIILLNPTIRGHIYPGRTTVLNYAPQEIMISGGTLNNIRGLHKESINNSLRRNTQVKVINTLINNDSHAPIAGPLFIEDVDFGCEITDDTPHIYTNYNNTANDHRLHFYGALVTSETSVRNTASGISWKMQLTNTDTNNYRHPTMNPVKWKIAETAVNASAQVTVTAYVRRSNTDFGIKLAVLARDNYHLGVTSDTSVTASGSVDTWEQITLNFTPNAAGVATIRCLFGAIANTSYAGYIDDIAITQA